MSVMLKITGRALTLLAVVGFTLASVTTPLIPNLAFLIGHFEQGIKLMIGAWGGCAVIGNVQDCPPTAFGFSLNLLNFPGRTNTGPSPIIAQFTYSMILLPITAFFALIGVALHTIARGRKVQMAAAALVGLAWLCGTGGFVFMFIIFMRALQRINEQFASSPAQFGPAIWMTVASYTLLLLGTILLCISIDKKQQLAGEQYHTMASESQVFALSKSNTRQSKKVDEPHDYYAEQEYFKSEPRVSAQSAHYAMQDYPPPLPNSYPPQPQHGAYYYEQDHEQDPVQEYYAAHSSPVDPQAQAIAASNDYSPSQMYEAYQEAPHQQQQQAQPQATQYAYSHRSAGSPRSSRKPVNY